MPSTNALVCGRQGLELQARTSAKTGEGVTEAFSSLVISIYDKDVNGTGGRLAGNSRKRDTRTLGQRKKKPQTDCTC